MDNLMINYGKTWDIVVPVVETAHLTGHKTVPAWNG
jgi:hypothetical protein